MNRRLFSSLVQPITLISVVIGLALVVWELRQGRELVRAELNADAIAQINAQNIALMGDSVYGRWWWKTFKPVEQEIIEFGDAYLAGLAEPACKNNFDGYRDLFADMALIGIHSPFIHRENT